MLCLEDRASSHGLHRPGLRNDASDDAMAMRQRWRLAEIRCEEYSFVLFSRFLNLLDAKVRAPGGAPPLSALHACAQLSRVLCKQGGMEALAGSDRAWALPLGAAVLGVRQLGLSAWEPAECLALENELGAWQQAGRLSEPLPALRCAGRCSMGALHIGGGRL